MVVLPPGSDRNDGFDDVRHTVDQLATQLGAPIEGVAVDHHVTELDQAFVGESADDRQFLQFR